MEIMYGTFINHMYMIQTIFHLIMKGLETIFQEIQPKTQYFHTYRKLDLVEGVTAITSQLHGVHV